jgi:hypothetical protein
MKRFQDVPRRRLINGECPMKQSLPIPVIIITILVVIAVVIGIYAMSAKKDGGSTTLTPEMKAKMLQPPPAPGGPPAKP